MHAKDPLSEYDLPPDVLSSTFEHAIGDDAMMAHECGHAVAEALRKRLSGSVVDYAFPGALTVQLRSGAVARCGGPGGWRLEVERVPGGEPTRVRVAVAAGETDAGTIAEELARALRRW